LAIVFSHGCRYRFTARISPEPKDRPKSKGMVRVVPVRPHPPIGTLKESRQRRERVGLFAADGEKLLATEGPGNPFQVKRSTDDRAYRTGIGRRAPYGLDRRPSQLKRRQRSRKPRPIVHRPSLMRGPGEPLRTMASSRNHSLVPR